MTSRLVSKQIHFIFLLRLLHNRIERTELENFVQVRRNLKRSLSNLKAFWFSGCCAVFDSLTVAELAFTFDETP